MGTSSLHIQFELKIIANDCEISPSSLDEKEEKK